MNIELSKEKELQFLQILKSAYGRQIDTPLKIIQNILGLKEKYTQLPPTEMKFFEFACLMELDLILNNENTKKQVNIRNILETLQG